MAASKGGPRAPKTVCGRRHCSVCGCWRYVIDFGPRAWADVDKTIVKYLHGDCRVCRRRAARKDYHQETPLHRKRRNQSMRVYHRRQRRQAGIPELGPRVLADKKSGSVDRLPFARWLQEKIVANSVKYVSNRTGLSTRRIHTIVNGYDKSGRSRQKGKTKFRPVDFVQLDTVDTALQEWGELPSKLAELYPPEAS